MSTDYKKLCKDLFGTDDIYKLKEISQLINTKKCVTNSNVEDMILMQQQGYTTSEIAKRFNISRQTVSKYLNPKLEQGYSMRMYFMKNQYVCTMIDINFLDKKIKILNRTSDIFERAFGVKEDPNWNDFEYFIRERCFPESRGNKKELLKNLSIDNYDPIRIIEKTEGRMANDNQYIEIVYKKNVLS